MKSRLREWATRLRRDVAVLLLAARDPRVPWHAKAVATVALAYALSPVDLVPDAIPVLGVLDDLLVVPALLALALTLVPADVAAALREEAGRREASGAGFGRAGAVAVVATWLVAAGLAGWWLLG